MECPPDLPEGDSPAEVPDRPALPSTEGNSSGQPPENTCLQCRYSAWLVGVGQGFRCFHPERKPPNRYAWLIPSRDFVCELFRETRRK